MRLKQEIAFAASLVVFAGTPWIQKSDRLEAQSAPTSADATNATNAANNLESLKYCSVRSSEVARRDL